MIEILQLPVLQDNYIYLLHEPVSGATAVVDPALAEPVLEELARKGWKLSHVLNTHHHGDHVGGNLALKQETACVIVGMGGDRARIPGIDLAVSDGDRLSLGLAEAKVLEVPGHTRGHIAYWFAGDDALFCGDTLFSLGCGRLFEGAATEMWASLEKIRRLPASTRIYCAHEYTEANARFAITIDPHNPALLERTRQIQELRSRGTPTVPSTLAQELAANPFLRPENQEIRRRLGLEVAADWEVFARIRELKDHFRAW